MKYSDKFWTILLLAFQSAVPIHSTLARTNPVASFSTLGTLCQNVAVDFIDNSSTSGGTIILWAWDFDDGSGSNVQNPSHVYTASGSYDVRLTIIDSDGESDVVVSTIIVQPAPNVDFTNTSTDNCLSTTQTFSSNASISAGSITGYQWTYGDGGISFNQNGSHTYAVAGTYSVTFTATSNLGCENSVTKEVTIFDEPVAGFQFESVCIGNPVSFVNTSGVSSGNLSYAWDFGDGTLSTLANPEHEFATTGIFPVSLEVTSNDGGCVSTALENVEIYENPVSSFSAALVCFGDATTFVNNSTGNNLQFLWNFGDGTTSTNFAPSHQYDTPGSYIVSLQVTSADNCTGTSESEIDVYSNPSPVFFAADQCLDNTVLFTNLTNENDAPYTYLWDFGDGQQSALLNPEHTYSAPGSYIVTLTAISASACQAAFQSDIIIHPLPAPGFSIAAGCDGVINTFPDQSSIASGSITSWQWDYGDGSTSTGQNGSHTYADPGVYDVTLTTTSEYLYENSITQQITIYAKPVTSFGFSDACLSNEITFSKTSTVSDGFMSYLWDFGDGSTSALVNPTHQFTSPGTYSVSLLASNNVGGCSTSATHQVDIYSIPVSDFSAAPVCFGDATTFVNNSTGNNLQFLWNFGDGTTSTNFAPTHQYDAPGAYIVSLQVTSEDNCTRTSESEIDVYANPSPVFFAADQCLDNTALFTNLTNENDAPYTYLWDFGDGQQSALLNPEHTYAAPGSYIVTLTAISASACQAAFQRDIIIHPLPAPGFSIAAGCDGVINTFPDQSSIASGSIISWQWSYGDGSTSTGQNGSHTYADPGVYDVTLTTTSEHSCQNSIMQQITTYAKPVTSFSFSDPCLSNEITFTNTSTVSDGFMSYLWDFGDGSTSALVNPTHQFTSLGTYSVSLLASNNVGGCATSATHQVDIYSIPVSDFSAAPVCFGDATTFVNNSTGNNLQFVWNFGDGTTSTDFAPSHQYDAPGAYIVSLQVTSADNCTRTSESEIDVYANPSPVFFAADQCLDNTALFTNLTNENDAPYAYLWDFGDGQQSALSNPEHTYAAPGAYSVTLTATSASACQAAFKSDIVIHPLPAPDFSVGPVCDGDPTFFHNLSEIASGSVVSYLWDFGDLTNSTERNPEKQYLNPGTYNVNLIVTSDKGCVSTIIKPAIVHPNPVANFEVSDKCFGDAMLFSNTSAGSSQLTYEWDFGDGNRSVVENPSHLYESPGIYTVRLVTTSSLSCQNTIQKSVITFPPPEVSAGKDTIISRGAAVQLNASGGKFYNWLPIESLDNSTVANPIARPLETTDYIVVITDQFGCQNQDTVRVEIREDFKVVANNIFTPDGNGQNDYWVVQNADAFDRVHARVYDRYGKIVFEDEDYQNNWEGTVGKDILPDGTYYYLITFPDTQIMYNGAITIIRNK